jgi:hypothetical protein
MKEFAGVTLSEEINWHKHDGFIDWVEMAPHEFKKFLKAWQKLDKRHKTVKDKDFIYGFMKGDKVAQWKYEEESMQLHHSTDTDNIWDIYNGRL